MDRKTKLLGTSPRDVLEGGAEVRSRAILGACIESGIRCVDRGRIRGREGISTRLGRGIVQTLNGEGHASKLQEWFYNFAPFLDQLRKSKESPVCSGVREFSLAAIRGDLPRAPNFATNLPRALWGTSNMRLIHADDPDARWIASFRVYARCAGGYGGYKEPGLGGAQLRKIE